ncbi:DUF192 domain-containing protein [Paraburkholderia sp. IW21]|uniref:DUF192 domain-containing protein n=1 Tax=Paraburkholderia sp. IW21 TaxID=3242488 RepID=UPI00352166BF
MKFVSLFIGEHPVGVRVSITETTRERMRGLLGRDGLPSDEALLLQRCWSVHTFGMRFAIDVLFLDSNGRVVGIRHEVPRRRMLLNLRATQTLELAAGAVHQHGIALGDQLAFEAPL